jgi:predicted Holliday junction resolvase-like endonuclease
MMMMMIMIIIIIIILLARIITITRSSASNLKSLFSFKHPNIYDEANTLQINNYTV